LELAANDHIKELIIVHSAPPYIPKQDDLSKNLVIEGNTMKIEKESYDPFGKSFKPKSPAKINQKIKP
jgi:hypothetical protein